MFSTEAEGSSGQQAAEHGEKSQVTVGLAVLQERWPI